MVFQNLGESVKARLGKCLTQTQEMPPKDLATVNPEQLVKLVPQSHHFESETLSVILSEKECQEDREKSLYPLKLELTNIIVFRGSLLYKEDKRARML